MILVVLGVIISEPFLRFYRMWEFMILLENKMSISEVAFNSRNKKAVRNLLINNCIYGTFEKTGRTYTSGRHDFPYYDVLRTVDIPLETVGPPQSFVTP